MSVNKTDGKEDAVVVREFEKMRESYYACNLQHAEYEMNAESIETVSAEISEIEALTIKYGTSVDENEEVWTSDTKDDDGLYVYNEEYSGKQNLTKKYKVRSERLRAVIAQRKVIEDKYQKMLEKWTNDRRRSGQTESKMKASD